MPPVSVERTYLEWVAVPQSPRPPGERPLPAPFSLGEEHRCTVSTYRRLYAAVGSAHHWVDRLAWSDEELARHLGRADVRIWVLRHAGEDAGYFELQRSDDGAVEIAYFGLMPAWHGRGLGRLLLGRAIAEAQGWHAERIWLHTCTLDGPHALPNYLARGFRPFRRETYVVDLPDR